MIIDNPRPEDIPELKELWQQAFGDPEAVIEDFFTCGFSYDRCRCLLTEGKVAAALYWFDGALCGKKVAYLYAIATQRDHQKRGFCHLLMADTHAHLQQKGYSAAILKPATEALAGFYARMGYQSFGSAAKRAVQAGAPAVGLRRLTREEFAVARRDLLPEGSIVQEGAALELLHRWAEFYGAQELVVTVSREEPRKVLEYLGPEQKLPGVLTGLQMREAIVCDGLAGGMYHMLEEECPVPTYLGLPLD